MQAFLLNKIGAYSNLTLKTVPDPKPANDEVIIKQTAIGINHFDICFRNGFYPINQDLAKKPAIIGLEACGVIEALGRDVVDYKVGERVAYATGPIGAYAEKRAVKQNYLISPPKSLSDEMVVACLLKGLMAHTLLFRVYLAPRVKRILVHSAAGGVGHLLCQWARHLKIEVIGTVGSEAKISPAKLFGCKYVINRNDKNFLKEVESITEGEGVGLVYDGLGKETIFKSIDCLYPMAMCVSYGEVTGLVPPLDLNFLMPNSLYITKPMLVMYKAKRMELVLAANEVFKLVESGVLKPQITSYDFVNLAKAHQDFESKNTIGSLVVKV